MSMMKEENFALLDEIISNISGVVDKLILSTELTADNMAEAMPLGGEECWSEHLYCLYEKNAEKLHQNLDTVYPDSCSYIMKEYPYSRWNDTSAFTRTFISDCIEQRLKVFVFGLQNGFQIPIDFITNRFCRWILLDGFTQSWRRFKRL